MLDLSTRLAVARAHLDYNPILDTDSYKNPHFLMTPQELEDAYSYLEARKGKYVFPFGLQGWLIHRLGQQVQPWHLEEARELLPAHGVQWNEAGWKTIIEEFGGIMPLEVRGVDEGRLFPCQMPMVTVQSTDPRFGWLSNNRETSLLRQVWYGSTALAREADMKRRLAAYWDRTCDDYDGLGFAVLDFSSRGAMGYDANEVGGSAHLACFIGTDSLPAVRYAKRYYDIPMPGFSVDATEHYVMCTWKADGPEEIRQLLAQVGQRGKPLSIVGDTWNIFKFAETAASMADEFKAAGVKCVVRGDSGDMTQVIPEVLRTLANGFGASRNGKGFYEMHGAAYLQADGVNSDNVTRPFEIAESEQLAAKNIMCGSGGGLQVEGLTRDTLGFAGKASAIRRRGQIEWDGIAKDPITDPGKKSKPGRHMVIEQDDGAVVLISGADAASFDAERPRNLLKVRWRNGAFHNLTNLEEVRARVDAAVFA